MPDPILTAEEEKIPDTESAWTQYMPFLRAALRADRKGETDAAAELGKSLDVTADEINTLAAELLGDILLEEDESGAFVVIEDYLELAEGLF
jgi:predicted RNA-binding protein (virulence factor B family)